MRLLRLYVNSTLERESESLSAIREHIQRCEDSGAALGRDSRQTELVTVMRMDTFEWVGFYRTQWLDGSPRWKFEKMVEQGVGTLDKLG